MSSKKTINVKGMTCKACVKLIESEVGSMDGVENVKVDLVNEKADVKFDSKKTNLKKIESKISKLGYSTDNFDAAKDGGFFKGLQQHDAAIERFLRDDPKKQISGTGIAGRYAGSFISAGPWRNRPGSQPDQRAKTSEDAQGTGRQEHFQYASGRSP